MTDNSLIDLRMIPFDRDALVCKAVTEKGTKNPNCDRIASTIAQFQGNQLLSFAKSSGIPFNSTTLQFDVTFLQQVPEWKQWTTEEQSGIDFLSTLLVPASELKYVSTSLRADKSGGQWILDSSTSLSTIGFVLRAQSTAKKGPQDEEVTAVLDNLRFDPHFSQARPQHSSLTRRGMRGNLRNREIM